VFQAKSANKPRDELQHFGEVLRIYSPKLGRVYDHQPDRETCAQLMDACSDRRESLDWLIRDVFRTRTQPGESPMWWVTVALQRLHKIPPKATAARRAEWRQARRPNLVNDQQRAADVWDAGEKAIAIENDAAADLQAIHEGIAHAAAKRIGG
jgi:hypothetical protein